MKRGPARRRARRAAHARRRRLAAAEVRAQRESGMRWPTPAWMLSELGTSDPALRRENEPNLRQILCEHYARRSDAA